MTEKSREASEEREREHVSNLSRLETASELSSRWLYKLQAKISGHAVLWYIKVLKILCPVHVGPVHICCSNDGPKKRGRKG